MSRSFSLFTDEPSCCATRGAVINLLGRLSFCVYIPGRRVFWMTWLRRSSLPHHAQRSFFFLVLCTHGHSCVVSRRFGRTSLAYSLQSLQTLVVLAFVADIDIMPTNESNVYNVNVLFESVCAGKKLISVTLQIPLVWEMRLNFKLNIEITIWHRLKICYDKTSNHRMFWLLCRLSWLDFWKNWRWRCV